VQFEEKYQLGKPLGQGAAGEVVLARRRSDGLPLAIKFLRGGESIPEERERFLEEVRHLGKVNSPYVVRILDAGDHGGQFFFAMELVDGRDLSTVLERLGALKRNLALRLARDIAKGLVAIHAQDIVHRDLKPSNVMITRKGRGKLADFGLAKSSTSAVHTRTGMILGTPGYISPEVLEGSRASPASDVYALGLMLFAMLQGRRVFLETNLGDLIRAQLEGPDEIDVELLDADIQPFFQALTRRDPARRPTATEAAKTCLDLLQKGYRKPSLLPETRVFSKPPPRPPGATSLNEIKAEKALYQSSSAAHTVLSSFPAPPPEPAQKSAESTIHDKRKPPEAPPLPLPRTKPLFPWRHVVLGLGTCVLLLGWLLLPGSPRNLPPSTVASSPPLRPRDPFREARKLLKEMNAFRYSDVLMAVLETIPVQLDTASFQTKDEQAIHELESMVKRNQPYSPAQLRKRPYVVSWPPKAREKIRNLVRSASWYQAAVALQTQVVPGWWTALPPSLAGRIASALVTMQRIDKLDALMGGRGDLLGKLPEVLQPVLRSKILEQFPGPVWKTLPHGLTLLDRCVAVTQTPSDPLLLERNRLVRTGFYAKYCAIPDADVFDVLSRSLPDRGHQDWIHVAIGLYDLMSTTVVRVALAQKTGRELVHYEFHTRRSNLTHVETLFNNEWEARPLQVSFRRNLLEDGPLELRIYQEDLLDPLQNLVANPHTTWVIVPGVALLEHPY
jgi:serine/threonine-protein kinase